MGGLRPPAAYAWRARPVWRWRAYQACPVPQCGHSTVVLTAAANR
jgi:hypothetical protein